jgi:hypothetical protein
MKHDEVIDAPRRSEDGSSQMIAVRLPRATIGGSVPVADLQSEPVPGNHANWRRCKKCKGMYHVGGTQGSCPAGGEHDPTGSLRYFLQLA